MFVTPAFAQSAVGGAPDMLVSVLPFVLIFVIMYFLIIRPQRTQQKKRAEMLSAVRRGDTVVTGGGLIGKVQLDMVGLAAGGAVGAGIFYLIVSGLRNKLTPK